FFCSSRLRISLVGYPRKIEENCFPLSIFSAWHFSLILCYAFGVSRGFIDSHLLISGIIQKN
ncbi:unnamed protein product, partial [Arabidopsis halleri]